jgi:hypothetical protein
MDLEQMLLKICHWFARHAGQKASAANQRQILRAPSGKFSLTRRLTAVSREV